MVRQEHFRTYVEIGVWKGHSLVHLANLLQATKRPFELFAVDLFEDSWQHTPDSPDGRMVRALYEFNLLRHNCRNCITDIKGMSWECASKFEDKSVDFCFIDAAHDYDSVIKDINAWMHKIKPGGIISGHDYDPNNTATGVPAAVEEIFGKGNVEIKNDVWFKFV